MRCDLPGFLVLCEIGPQNIAYLPYSCDRASLVQAGRLTTGASSGVTLESLEFGEPAFPPATPQSVHALGCPPSLRLPCISSVDSTGRQVEWWTDDRARPSLPHQLSPPARQPPLRATDGTVANPNPAVLPAPQRAIWTNRMCYVCRRLGLVAHRTVFFPPRSPRASSRP